MRRILQTLDFAYALIGQCSLAWYGRLPYLQSKETTVASQDTPTPPATPGSKSACQRRRRAAPARAALSGRTLSEFVVTSAQDKARRVIAEHESIRLSREEQQAFVQALLQPPEPNARLKRAAKAYFVAVANAPALS